jgi:hypothetical protein
VTRDERDHAELLRKATAIVNALSSDETCGCCGGDGHHVDPPTIHVHEYCPIAEALYELRKELIRQGVVEQERKAAPVLHLWPVENEPPI